MNASETITPKHLSRQAVIYIRQSSPQQTVNNQESLRLQYALKQRAQAYGWPADRIDIVDADLGRTGSTTEGRHGFKDLVARVTLGQVGIIFAYDVTRLARNCTDWYQLLDLCGYRNCLVGDQDGVYDPTTTNGRLILGLKGLISELELHTLRARMTAGLLNKAERGELAQMLPVGLSRDALGRVVKNPDMEVQSRIGLVFDTFLRVRAISQVIAYLNEQGLSIPRRNRFGDVEWRQPTLSSVSKILQNPAYAGAFVYGRTRMMPSSGSSRSFARRRLPADQWKICVRDKYPAYIDWDGFERIQAMIRDNHSAYDRHQTRGVPRGGKVLLHGIVYCGECGHKMVVQYKGGSRYICNHLRQQNGCPVCQFLPSDSIDEHVVRLFFEALAPAELDVYAKAVSAFSQQEEHVRKARQQQIERLRYQARLAERQFNQVDPDNRLVAGELERRWEAALRDLREAEETWEREQQQRPTMDHLDAETRRSFCEAGKRIPELWRTDHFAPPQKKALLRCLIDKVVLRRIAPDQVHCRVVWKGGDTTSADVPVTVSSVARLSRNKEMKAAIVKLARQGKSDEAIAAQLTEQGHRSPRQMTLLRSTVRRIRLQYGVLTKGSQSHPRRVPGYLTVTQIAEQIAVSPHWIYHRLSNGTIKPKMRSKKRSPLFPDEPATLTRFKQLLSGKLQTLRF